MSPEKQRIAIAKACGWTAKRDSNGWWRAVHKLTGNAMAARLSERSVWSVGIPDYLNDLNAMHEAEQVLTPKYEPAKGESQWGEYLGWLGFCGENKTREVYECVTATAAQRAQAFLRTLGLWQETPTQPQ